MEEREEIIEDFKTRESIQMFIGKLSNEECYQIANKLKKEVDIEIVQDFDEGKRMELADKILEREVDLKGSETFKERFRIYLDGICENADLSEDIVQQLDQQVNQYFADFLDTTDEFHEERKAPIIGDQTEKNKRDSPWSSERYRRRSYPMERSPRGTCIIINNTFNYDKKLRRSGTNVDRDRLEKLFKWLDFEVDVRNDMTADEMHELFDNDKLGGNIREDSDCFVCCILTHGGPSVIYGNDNKPVSRKILRESVQTKSCKILENKPKIFFLQACRKGLDQKSRRDAVPAPQDTRSPYSDIYMVAATTEDTYAYRDETSGSVFIQTVCDVFEEYADQEPFIDMMERVNNVLSKRIIPTENEFGEEEYDHQVSDVIMGTLCGKLLFNPRCSFKDY